MRTTTKLFALAMAAAVITAVITLSGCKKDNNGDGPDNPDNPNNGDALVVNDTVVAEYPGDTYNITVLSDVAWTATVEGDAKEWITVSPAAGETGETSVSVIVKNNPGVTNRAATITFSGGDLTGTTAVTQYAVPNTFCEKCAWDATAGEWVDAYVTTYAYPFETREPYVGLNLFDYSLTADGGFVPVDSAASDKDGRANTDSLVAANSQVALECRKLGPNWYLPAFEELINISSGSMNAPLNGKPGLNLLEDIQGVVDFYQSSTLGVTPGSTNRKIVDWGWTITDYGVGVNIHVFVHKTGEIVAAGNAWTNTFHAFYRE